MHLLVWSPVCWGLVDRESSPQLAPQDRQRYGEELECIGRFVAVLLRTARVLAHLPTCPPK